MKKLSLSIITLGLAGAVGAYAAVPTDLLGDVASASEATRTVEITPATRYVNVMEGDVVTFKGLDQSFTFRFDGTASDFDLQRVAPAGMLDHHVTVYVEEPGAGRSM
jgi:hypothetical protein